MKTIVSNALALALLLPLAACSQSGQSQSQPVASGGAAAATKEANQNASPTWIAGEIRKGMQEAKQKLARENIDVNNIRMGDDRHGDDDSRPKAEITPQGELLIAGKKVATTPAQQTLGIRDFVAAYRAHYDLTPTQRSFFVYEATLLAVDAIRRAGSDRPAAVEQALKTTTMASLLGGNYAPDDPNHAHTPLQIMGMQDGRPAVIATE